MISKLIRRLPGRLWAWVVAVVVLLGTGGTAAGLALSGPSAPHHRPDQHPVTARRTVAARTSGAPTATASASARTLAPRATVWPRSARATPVTVRAQATAPAPAAEPPPERTAPAAPADPPQDCYAGPHPTCVPPPPPHSMLNQTYISTPRP